MSQAADSASKRGWVYLAKCREETTEGFAWMKFGVSRTNPYDRVRSLNFKGSSLHIVCTVECEHPFKLESIVKSWIDLIGLEREGEFFFPLEKTKVVTEIFHLLRDIDVLVTRTSRGR